MDRSEARLIASLLALAAFAVAVTAGLAADVPTGTILTRAILAMVAANIVGWPLGLVVDRIIADHVARYAAGIPVPTADAPGVSAVGLGTNSGSNVDGKK